jgi:glycosyltransferase involved in cell wall biosynthesis
MNILLLTHSYPDKASSWRGTFVREQARAVSLNNNVAVVYFKVDNEHFAPFAKYVFSKTQFGNLTEYTVIVKRSFPVINQVNYLLKTYRFIRKEILPDFKPDLIHSHLSYPAGFIGTIIQKRKNIPNIVTEHSRITNYFRSWFHKKCIIYTFNNAAGIIAVSNSLKEEIRSFSNRPVSVIHNIVDTGRFNPAKPEPGTSLNIGFLGGLGNNNKGLDLLLKAVSMPEKRDFLLHIGGNGALIGFYRNMAKEYGIESNCKFYGEIVPEKIPGFYSGLDLFILPSRYETFGIVLVEAMACGIPVIATKCGGPEEIVIPSAGILIEKENPEELAGAILKISENRALYNSEAIRSYAVNTFGKQAYTDRIAALYKETLMKNLNE